MIEVKRPAGTLETQIQITGSKSISNRVLLLNEIFNMHLQIINSSNSEDTNILKQSLKSIKQSTYSTIDVKHAGTCMRFLTAFLSLTEGEWILTGSQRMKQRPIVELVNALKQIGANIDYLENEGYPPLKITGQKLQDKKIKMNANISSQYISALLLIAPLLKNGLELELVNQTVSKPYVLMTLALLKQFGFEILHSENTIVAKPQNLFKPNLKNTAYQVESDWSSASYWYSVCALSKGSQITLSTFFDNTLQADGILKKLFEPLGVKTIQKNDTIVLQNQLQAIKTFEYDFTDCPDIAQTIALTCFALGIKAKLKGLKTLKIKETDRISALKTELEKCGALVKVDEESIEIESFSHNHSQTNSIHINTYQDHRMALSFAPLALLYKSVIFDDEKVIAKSYPGFWDDLKKAGFTLKYY